VRRESPGPAFYRGQRTGKDGKPFRIVKFRTMYEDSRSYRGPHVTAEDDPRVTPLGKWLRDTKFNELPQLWNVLKGEMSLVGPRPEHPDLARTWPLDLRREILSVRPGITSPASVQYRNEEGLLEHANVEHAYMEYIVPSKLRLDQLYVRYRSFWLDLDTLFWTMLVLLPRLKRYTPSEDFLYWGPVSKLVRRYLTWFSIDTLISFCAMTAAGLIFRGLRPLDVGLPLAVALTLGFAMLFSLSGALMGANHIAWSEATYSDALDLLPPHLLATLTALVCNAYLPSTHFWHAAHALPAGMLLLGSALALAGFVGVRYRLRLLDGLGKQWVQRFSKVRTAQERALIVGSGDSGQFAAWLLDRRHRRDALILAGYIDDDLYKQGERIQGLPVLGKRGDIPQVVAKHDVGVIIFAIHNIASQERQEILEICARTPARLVIAPDIVTNFTSAIRETLSGVRERKPGVGGVGGVEGRAIPAHRLEAGLAKLEALAQSGDMDAVQDQIRRMRGLFLE
jgi:lipopolysaccharide/colanic/teichoic acid biosynthesis glycosyltransferase